MNSLNRVQILILLLIGLLAFGTVLPRALAVQPPPDSDGDGITDDVDQCPNEIGVLAYNGCPVPDTDGDGVTDDVDQCLAEIGVLAYNGCPVPDTDGDGITDDLDQCLTEIGVLAYNGCPVPDTDGDGVTDDVDQCLAEIGVLAYNGCPVPDTDGDGITDDLDQCLTETGVVAYNGCPVPDTDGDSITDDVDLCLTDIGVEAYNGCPIPDSDGDGITDDLDQCLTDKGSADNLGCPSVEIAPINLYLTASTPSFTVGTNASIEVWGDNLANLHGVAVICQTDPSILNGVQVAAGSLFDPVNQFVSDSGFDVNGSWTIGITQQAPADPLSGSGQLMILTFQGMNLGAGLLSCEFKASDRDGNSIPVITPNMVLTLQVIDLPQPEPTEEANINDEITVPLVPQIKIISEAETSVYSGPATAYSILGSANPTDLFTVLGYAQTDQVWFAIQLANGQQAWVAQAAVELVEGITLADLLQITDFPPPEGNTPADQITQTDDTDNPPAPVLQVEIISEVGAFVRSQPDVNSDPLATVDAHQLLTAIGYTEVDLIWFAVQLPDGQTGWVSETVAALIEGLTLDDLPHMDNPSITYQTVLKGQITLTQGLTNVQIVLHGDDHELKTTILEDGSFIFEGYSPGDYTLTVNADHYLSIQVNQTLGEGETVLSALTLVNGDVNQDQRVDSEDFALVSISYGLTVPPSDPMFDLDNNGAIDLFDLTIISANFNTIMAP